MRPASAQATPSALSTLRHDGPFPDENTALPSDATDPCSEAGKEQRPSDNFLTSLPLPVSAASTSSSSASTCSSSSSSSSTSSASSSSASNYYDPAEASEYLCRLGSHESYFHDGHPKLEAPHYAADNDIEMSDVDGGAALLDEDDEDDPDGQKTGITAEHGNSEHHQDLVQHQHQHQPQHDAHDEERDEDASDDDSDSASSAAGTVGSAMDLGEDGAGGAGGEGANGPPHSVDIQWPAWDEVASLSASWHQQPPPVPEPAVEAINPVDVLHQLEQLQAEVAAAAAVVAAATASLVGGQGTEAAAEQEGTGGDGSGAAGQQNQAAVTGGGGNGAEQQQQPANGANSSNNNDNGLLNIGGDGALGLVGFNAFGTLVPLDDDANGWDPEVAHPMELTNPVPQALGPDNIGLTQFLRQWAWEARREENIRLQQQQQQARSESDVVGQGTGNAADRADSRTVARRTTPARTPWLKKITELSSPAHPSEVRYVDLAGDRCDFQGIDWQELGVTRRDARLRRMKTYKNYTNMKGSDHRQRHDTVTPPTDDFFRFRRMNVRRNVHLAHFQLRNVLAAQSRGRVFYAGADVVHYINPATGQGGVAMDMTDMQNMHVSTMAAECGVLVAGGFNGEYALRRLDAVDDEDDDDKADEEGRESGGATQSTGRRSLRGRNATAASRRARRHGEGYITTDQSGITNHVQVYASRTSGTPLAAFASNDSYFRVFDLAHEKWLSTYKYQAPLNCSALSPDGRLRVMVGDHFNVLVASAESGEILQDLPGHRDYGFACAWADDGFTVATGFQDRAIKVWDARRWRDASGEATPVATLRTNMAGVRSLRFSPVGSGPRVLVAAEEADYVDVFDARGWRSKQSLDIFGEIGGAAFADEGRDLHVLCCDPHRGGLLQFERCAAGAAESDHDRDFAADEPAVRSAVWRGRAKGIYDVGPPNRAVPPARPAPGDWYDGESTAHFVARTGKGGSVTRRRRMGARLAEMDPF